MKKEPFDPLERVENALRDALRPVDPPAGFADRVLQRAAARSAAPGRSPFVAAPLVRWATAAAIVVAAGGGLWYRAEERRRAEGEEARRQVLLSLKIAGSKLEAVRVRINHQQESLR